MVLFDFKSDKHFVASLDRTTLKVYELTNPTVSPSSIRKNHWKEIASITARDYDESEDEDEGDDDGASAEEEESYDGLMFFDGHGKIEGREALTKLAQHLTRLQLRVSPQGHCFQDVTGLGEHKDFGFHYLRLNDLFNWSYHGIKMASIIVWRHLVLEYTVPKGEKQLTVVGGVRKERYEELKKMIGMRDEELEKLREEMDEQDLEMEKLKEMRGKHETELRELEKKNGKELRKLLKKKDGELEDKNDELEMLRNEKDDEAKLSKGKDEELKKLREEVKKLRRATKKEDEATTTTTTEKEKIMVDSDEWHKLKKDEAEMRQEVMKKGEEMKRRLAKEKNDNEALQRIMDEKDVESQKLRNEKEEMMKENAAETQKLREQVLQVHHEQEQRRKQLWVHTATTKLLSICHRNDHLTSRRRPVPRETWTKIYALGNLEYSMHNKTWKFPLACRISLVDEDPKDWPPPPKINVYSYTASFDQDNWWFIRTTHPDGGLTMMAYYDGNVNCSIKHENGSTIRLPYGCHDTLFRTDTPCALAHLGGELKLAFMYRE